MLLIRFPLFWFVDAPLFLVRLFPKILDIVEDQFAVGLHARMIFVPLFKDTSYVGRLLSFFFRVSRVLAGITAVLSSLIVLAFIFAVWLTLPFLVIIFGGWLGLVNVLLSWTGFTLFVADRPHHNLTGKDDLDTLERVATSSVKRALSHPGTPVDLIDRLLGFAHIRAIFAKMGVDREKFRQEVRKRARKMKEPVSLGELYRLSLAQARRFAHRHVTLADLFIALLEDTPALSEALFEEGISLEEARRVVRWMDRQWRLEHPPHFWDAEYKVKRLGGVNRAWTARPTPNLNRLGVDITRQVQTGKLSPVAPREDVIGEIIQILSRTSRDNVLIVGPAGVGKSTLVTSLAAWIIEGDVDPVLFSKRVVRLDVPRLIAGVKTQGEFEKRLIGVLNEVRDAGNIILFIDQIHTLTTAGTGEGSLNVFAAFEPYLADPAVQVIGATSWLDYRRYIEPKEAFARMFQLVEVSEPDEAQTLKVLELVTVNLERKYKVTISYQALRAAYQLTEKFIHDRVQPDKAIDALEEAAVMVSRARPGGSVTHEDVGRVIAQKTEIPLTQVTGEESAKLMGLEKKLHERVIGQDEAIKAVADALRRARVGLREEDRPIAALMFVGPTGVGKTELAKALAEAYFGSESAMIRLDMSEYQTRDSVASLIGPPPSSSGAPVPGRLTEAVRRKPFSLILLDELEKADPDVINLFLQVFEDGRLTDGAGRTVKFNNTIIIATSNAGTELFRQASERHWTEEETRQRLEQEFLKYFRPELLNRFDGIIVCGSLSKEELLQVVRLKLEKIKEQMAEKDIVVRFSEALVEELARRGYDPHLGARPLRRLLQDTVEAYLARRMLSGEISRGDVVKLGPEILPT
jgi:ATP-dependent Clp protease ATP-binding subunit ClpC